MRKILYWLYPIVWVGVIFYSSAQPYEKQNIKPFLADTIDLSYIASFFDWLSFSYHNAEVSVDNLGAGSFVEFFIRKGTHVTVFFILMCLFYMALGKTTNLHYISALAASFFLTVAYAGLDEFHQSFTANRTPYVGDIVLDSVGALLAVLFLLLIHHWKKRRQDRREIKVITNFNVSQE